MKINSSILKKYLNFEFNVLFLKYIKWRFSIHSAIFRKELNLKLDNYNSILTYSIENWKIIM